MIKKQLHDLGHPSIYRAQVLLLKLKKNRWKIVKPKLQ